jgi:SAM-dependent methyltransferase
MIQARVQSESSDRHSDSIGIALQCPSCCRDLGNISHDSSFPSNALATCLRCSFWIRRERGIWMALTPERQLHYRKFMQDYERIRSLEGRGSTDAEYYLALPFKDLTGANSKQWQIRSRTYQCFQQRILPGLEVRYGRMRVLDIGAGNCWLSYRLASRGHQPVAVDLLVNEADGLGAANHYAGRLALCLPRFQAEMDRLPFSESQFDCAIFNASFHYSEDYIGTLKEAIRCLRPGGTVIIADSAWYEREESGEKMLQERRSIFEKKFGTPSDSIASREYLTDESLRALEERFGFTWRAFRPSYGVRWALRPMIAKLRRRREPSRFRIYAAEVQK